MTNIRKRLLTYLIRWYISNYKFPAVLDIFWREFRDFYNEDNLPSALATVTETLEECNARWLEEAYK